MSTTARVSTAIALWVGLVAGTAGLVRADTSTSLGDRTGEGSTVFTGVAQAPEANLFTGALATGVPIEVPPGRKSMTPQLRLQHSSSGGPGPFGFGWDLPIGRIERATKHGVPRCTGSFTDDFVLVLPTGAVELIAESTGGTFYRPKIEEAYVRAEKFASQNYWVVRDRAGMTYTFGDVDAARVGNSTPLTFLTQDPDGTCRLTTTWALTRVEDPNGNTMDVTWSKILNVLYPVTIRYGGNSQSGGPAHVYTVRFLQEWRPAQDRLRSYHAGVAARLVRRIYAIEVETDVPSAETPVRSYGLYYQDGAPGGGPEGYQSLLSAVSVTGRPTQYFVYTSAATGHETATASITRPAGLYGELRVANDSLEVSQTILDMNGDGLADLVRSDLAPAGSWRVHWGYVDGDAFGFESAPAPWAVPGNWTVVRDVVVSSGSCNNNGWSCTEQDTFDITGDGVPDYVDASSNSAWVVYRGQRGASGWEFAPGVSWSAPNRDYIRRSYEGDTYQDVVDMNGDGLADLVVSNASAQPPYQWNVYLNTGAGFAATPLPAFPAPVDRISDYTAGAGTMHQLVDFNGDGLPDLVKSIGYGFDERCMPSPADLASCLEVYLNTGQGFEATAELIPIPPSLAVQVSQRADDISDVSQDLFDVNGDGLPDLVYRRLVIGGYESAWRVQLNLGGTLEPLTFVPSVLYPELNREGIPARFWPGSDGGPIRRSVRNNSRYDLADLNGDGLLDHVQAGGATWQVRLHAAVERPNLLVVMENGLGGTNTVAYEPSTTYANDGGNTEPDLPFVVWVVEATRQSDGLCTPPAGADVFDPAANPCIDAGHERVATFAFEDGRFDAAERELRGFRRVVRTGVEGSGTAGNQTVTYFGQDTATKGRILQVDTYAGASVQVRSEVNTWGTRSAGRWTQFWLSENGQTTFDLQQGGGTFQFAMLKNDPPDGYGNITHFYRAGSADAGRVDTYTTYASPQSGYYVFDRPSRVRVEDAGGVLEERWFYYDGSGADGLSNGAVQRGNLKRAKSRLTASSANGPQTRMTYDAYGNPATVTDGNGHVTTTTYDAYALYPTAVTNAAGHYSTAEFDYRWSQPIRVTDANGAVTEYAYDAAGRRTCTARPLDSLASCSSTATYHFATTPGELSWVEMAEKQDAPHPPLWTRQYFDALGRARYTDRLRVVDGASVTVRSNQIDYDAGGRVQTAYQPYPASAGQPNNGAVTYDYHLNGSAFIDPLGRSYRVTNADQTSRRTEYFGARTTLYDEEENRTDIVTDAFGRALTRTAYNGAAAYATTEYTYDGLGRLRTTKLNGATVKTITYDSLGRKTQMVDQNSGTWRYGYDGVGNLLWQDDPAPDQHVQFCYDAVDRPIRRCPLPSDYQQYYSCDGPLQCGDPEEVRYTYDGPGVPNAIGRLTAAEDPSGMTEFLQYDPRGRPLQVRKTIDVEGSTRRGLFAYGYDTNDRVVTVMYPDGELVYTEYDDAGQPIALRNQSNRFYVTDARYDVFGRPTEIRHENGVTDRRSYDGAANRHRLVALSVEHQTGRYLDLTYDTYTPRGLLQYVADRRNLTGELSNTTAFTYDPLGRLLGADSAYGPNDRTFAYDAMGNVTRHGDRYLDYDNPARPHQVTEVHSGSPTGPAVAVLHDANGNRAQKGTHEYVYDKQGRLDRVEVGAYAVRFVHDYRGRQTARILNGSGYAATRYYSELAETTGNYLTKWYFLGPLRVASQRTSYVSWETASLDQPLVELAATGMGAPALVVRLAGGAPQAAGIAFCCVAVGLLLAPWRRRRVVGIAVRPGHAIGVALAWLLVTLPWPIALQPRPAEAGGYGGSTIYHYHLDHLGSTQVITDEAGLLHLQIRYLPYGEVRGQWDRNGTLMGGGWSQRYEFTGYETESLSGLQYAGARFYDPEIGSFLTHDPATQFASPYSYGGGDPVNWTDPDGTFFPELLVAVIVAAAASAAINAVIAAAQGLPSAMIGKAAIGGAIAGAVGVGLGVVISSAAMGVAAAANTLPTNVGFTQAVQKLGEVAYRSAFSTTVANAAGQAAAAAGAPSEAVSGISAAAGLAASVAFDKWLLPSVQAPAEFESGVRVQLCSTTAQHQGLTSDAAYDAKVSLTDVEPIVEANLKADNDVWSNQSHFDFGAQAAFENFRDASFQTPNQFLANLGTASHHLQDQYALGHMFPGTSYFRGPVLSPIRFILHNVVGGEVTFRQQSYEATRTFFEKTYAIGA